MNFTHTKPNKILEQMSEQTDESMSAGSDREDRFIHSVHSSRSFKRSSTVLLDAKKNLE